MGNITRAARALNVSQPSLGMQIRMLEEELGVSLMDRRSRGIVVTAAGALLAQRARRLLQEVDSIASEVRALASCTRRKVVIGVPPSVIRLIGHDLLLYVQQAFPDVALSLVEERSVTLIKAMERDEIDYAFAYETEARPDLWRRHILEEELVFITAPSVSPPGGVIDLRAALQSDLAIADERGLIRKLVERAAARLDVHLTPTFEIQSTSALQAILQNGRATGFMPYGLAADHISRGLLTCSRTIPPVTRTLYVEGPNWRPAPLQQHELEQLCTWAAARLLDCLGPYARAVLPTR